MGTPRCYWYPDETGTLETLDLGEGLTDLQEEPSGEVTDAYVVSGPFRVLHRATFRVRIVLERFGTWGVNPVERDLQSLHSHLLAGGLVGFSRDHARTWAGMCGGPAVRGDTLLYTSGNGFTAWAAAGAISPADEVVIESPSPDGRREHAAVDAYASGQITIDRGLRYSHVSRPVVRWRDFYPVLSWPADQVGRAFVAHDHRRNWTLDLTLEYSVDAAVALWDSGYNTGYERQELGVGALSNEATTVALRDSVATGGWGGQSLGELLGGGGGQSRRQEGA